jgi:hypothetical protein
MLWQHDMRHDRANRLTLPIRYFMKTRNISLVPRQTKMCWELLR